MKKFILPLLLSALAACSTGVNRNDSVTITPKLPTSAEVSKAVKAVAPLVNAGLKAAQTPAK